MLTARSISAPCPYCGGSAPFSLQATDINRRISNELFRYHECRSCGLLFLRNVPANLGDYYPDEYYYLPKNMEELSRCAAPETYKVELVQRFKSGGRLIEIGPGSCGFAYLAQQAGFEVTAIEMNRRSCAFLRDVVGVAVIESTDELASIRQAGEADVIVLWQVIEHLLAPWELVRVASSRLKPGGILVLAAPNPDSFQRRVLKSRWVHLDAPRHVRLPTAKFIEKIAAAESLETVLVTTRDRGSIGWNRFGWRFFLGNLFRQRLMNKAAQLVGIVFSWVIAPFEAREGAGTAFTIVLRKRPA